jgi:hypothetical protein
VDEQILGTQSFGVRKEVLHFAHHAGWTSALAKVWEKTQRGDFDPNLRVRSGAKPEKHPLFPPTNACAQFCRGMRNQAVRLLATSPIERYRGSGANGDRVAKTINVLART